MKDHFKKYWILYLLLLVSFIGFIAWYFQLYEKPTTTIETNPENEKS